MRGLAQVNVLLSTLMGGVSGSAIADAAMEARILAPGMIRQGYSRGFGQLHRVTRLITATIPPGVGIILYGTTGEVHRAAIHRGPVCRNRDDADLHADRLDDGGEARIRAGTRRSSAF